MLNANKCLITSNSLTTHSLARFILRCSLMKMMNNLRICLTFHQLKGEMNLKGLTQSKISMLKILVFSKDQEALSKEIVTLMRNALQKLVLNLSIWWTLKQDPVSYHQLTIIVSWTETVISHLKQWKETLRSKCWWLKKK